MSQCPLLSCSSHSLLLRQLVGVTSPQISGSTCRKYCATFCANSAKFGGVLIQKYYVVRSSCWDHTRNHAPKHDLWSWCYVRQLRCERKTFFALEHSKGSPPPPVIWNGGDVPRSVISPSVSCSAWCFQCRMGKMNHGNYAGLVLTGDSRECLQQFSGDDPTKSEHSARGQLLV